MIRFLPIILGLFVLPLINTPALAHHREAVLGEATPSSELVFPPVTAGTGFILPDSPLFFLDKTFQQVKLLLAFSAEQKARIRSQIAGERMAELRLMLVRENQAAINTVLLELQKETDLAAASLTEAAAKGALVEPLAKELNETIKLHRKILNVLESQAGGVLRLQLKATRQALKESKIEVEDELSDEDLEIEIEESLEEEIEDEVKEAAESAQKIQEDLLKLEREASKAAAKALNRREEAIKKAIEERNEALRDAEERLLEAEKKRQERLLEARKKASEQAREAIKRAQDAAAGLKTAQETVSELKSGSSDNEDSDSSGSSDSGSGPSNSSSSED